MSHPAKAVGLGVAAEAAASVPVRARQRANTERRTARLLVAPSVVLLFAWMVVPLGMTVWFSLLHYNLLEEGSSFVGPENFAFLLHDPSLATAILNTVMLVGGVLAATVALGMLTALVVYQPLHGRGVLRLLIIAPFFIMPTVSALVWKNLLMNPVTGLFAWICQSVGLRPVDWFADLPLLAIGVIVAWQWLPFATLIFLTALQSLDHEQMEAARLDGAGPLALFAHIVAPHLARPVSVVVMIETIFLLSVFAEILVTTQGGPGEASTNLPYLIYKTALLDYDIGGASAGGLVAVVLANIVAFFLVRTAARNLDR